jgi:hypothetical protein
MAAGSGSGSGLIANADPDPGEPMQSAPESIIVIILPRLSWVPRSG